MKAGRDTKENNDLFYLCSLIEYIARKTKNERSVVVNALGKANIEKILEIADVLHSEDIDNVACDFIEKCAIRNGQYDNVAACKFAVPTHWDIGKIYKRLINDVKGDDNIEDVVITVYNSVIVKKIDDYNSAFYYDNPQNIALWYEENGRC